MNRKRLFSLIALVIGSTFSAFSAFAAPNTVQFSPATYTVNENAGQVIVTASASRLGDPNEVITATFQTRDGSALAGQDYVATTGTVTFNAGETEKPVAIQILNDGQLENLENFFVDLTGATNATVTTGSSKTATVNIADDDSGSSTIQFSSRTFSANEGDGVAALTVVRSGGIGLVASFTYTTSDGSATAGADYTTTAQTVSFASGETQKTITVPIFDDSIQENAETFSVTLSKPSTNAAIGDPAVATVTISDNDGGSTVQFSPSSYTVNENAGTVVLTVVANRLGDPNTSIAVNFATRDGSAVAAQDYSSVSGTVTFNAGETQKQIAVRITNDALLENPENFFVDLSNPTNASVTPNGATATVTIADDDSQTSTIQFNTDNYSVNENGNAVTLMVFRSGGTGLTASVNYATSNGSAIAGSDYTATSGTLTFNPGETQKTITVAISDDALVEGNETFAVNLTGPSAGAALGSPSTSTVTIVDNDGGSSTVQFNPIAYSGTETPGNSTVTLTITANRLGDPSATITVRYATSDGSATAGSDYAATSGSVTFGPGETQKTVTVTILDDALVENPENFFVNLSNPTGASLSTGSTATVTINDGDSPNASIGFDPAKYEVDEGAGVVRLTVTRSRGTGFVANVNYATQDGKAVAGRNYASTSGSLTFAPGETSKTIEVPIIDEGDADSTLDFTVTITDANNTGFVGPNKTATVDILDNDVNTFRFRDGSYTVNERAGSVTLTVDVRRSGDPTQSISVDYVTTDGTAREGFKYARTFGRLTFGANVTTQTITVPILDEQAIEGNTDFNVFLSNPLPARSGGGGSRLGSPSSATVTILDDDARTFQFTSSKYTVANSSGDANLTVTFTRLGDVNGTYRVNYSTNDGSAVAGRDYTPSADTLTFGPGETAKTIAIQITPEPIGQPARDFQVRLSNPSPGAQLGQISIATVTITNPDFSTKLLNISTRGPVQTGNDVMIGGFIIRGDSAKRLVLRGMGPSLTSFGVPDAITDPNLTLTDENGDQLAFNDNYTTNNDADRQTLADNGLTPGDAREAAIVVSLGAGNYTSILRGTSTALASSKFTTSARRSARAWSTSRREAKLNTATTAP